MSVALALPAAAALAALAVLLFHRRHSARPWRGGGLAYHDGRRFANLAPTPDKSLADIVRWTAANGRERWPARIAGEPGPPPARAVDGGGLRVTLVNHATLLLQMDGLNLLTDPVWSERVGPFPWAGSRRRRAPGLRLEELPPIHAVLLTHNHYDHLDVPTLRRLRAAHRMPVVTPLGNGDYLRRFGIAGRDGAGAVHELAWGEGVELAGGVRVTALPAQHWSSRTPWDRRHALWCAFAIEGPSGRVYVAGDSGDGAHFADAGARHGPFRLALLPIGAFLPRWFMRDHHIGPDEAVAAAAALRARTSVVMHYGTFALGDDGPETPLAGLRAALARLGDAAPDVRALEHGIAFDVPPDDAPAAQGTVR